MIREILFLFTAGFPVYRSEPAGAFYARHEVFFICHEVAEGRKEGEEKHDLYLCM